MKAQMIRLLSVGAVLALLASAAQPAQAQLGVAAGLNFENFSDIEAENTNATLDNASGYHIGLFYDLAVGPLALRPGLFYRSVGEVEYDLGGVVNDVARFDLSMIEAPLDVRFRLAMLPIVKPYLMAGPVFSFPYSDDDEFDESLEDFNVSANVGLGVEISPPAFSLTFYPEVRYAFGISKVVRDFEFLGAEFASVEDDQRLNTFMLRLGVTF